MKKTWWQQANGKWQVARGRRQGARRWWQVDGSRWMMGILAALLLILLTSTPAWADPPPEHQYIEAYTGPETCEVCHLDAAEQVMHSVHYTWAEKMDHYSPLPGSIARINWLGILNPDMKIAGGCGRCHVGGGIMPGTPAAETPEAQAKIDCLICHAEVYDMNARYPEKDENGNWVLPGDTSLKAARSAARPTAEACLRCHLNAGGGKLYKRGVDFAPVADKHAEEATGDIHADNGMACVDCHQGEAHRVYGYAPTLWSRDYEERLTCESCHTDAPHTNPLINTKHTRLDCRTCHIRTTGGLMKRDWTAEPVYDPIKELYSPVDEVAPANSVEPIYKWYNGGRLKPGHWPGRFDDPDSRLQPFKLFQATVPVDAESGQPLPLKLGIYFKTGDLERAIQIGAREAGVAFSGTWQAKTFQIPLQLSHGILPADQALSCTDCHVTGGRLDFQALGYAPEDAAVLASISSPQAGEPKTLQVKIIPQAQPLEPSTLDQEKAPPAPKALEIPWTPIGVLLICLAVILIAGYVLWQLRRTASG